MLNRQALNIVANFSGVGARLIFSLAFNIVYFRLLGSESYGLIGFYASLAALSSLFDLGLNQTTVREVARREADQDRAGELRSVVFTLQFLLGGIGLSLGLLVALGARWIAASWFSVTALAAHEVAASVALMGGALALLFPANFFYGTLIGLQRQVLSNTIIVAATALRGALTVVALFGFGPSPVIFFFAQMIASAIEVAVLAGVIWRLLPSSPQRPRFDAGLLKTTWKFTSGTWLAVTFAQIATLGDKIILSTLLPLHLFGLYSLAVTVTTTIQRLAPPFTNTYFPYFVRLKEQDRPDVLVGAYRQACEFASAIFLAAGLLLMAYAAPIAHLLSADAADAARLAWLLALLAAANTVNVEMALPFSLQFAHGITAIALRINLALCVLYPAALVLLVPRYGMEAAAGLWLAANALMFPVLIVMTHRADPAGTGVALAGSHRPDAGLRRGRCAGGRRRHHARAVAPADADLDRPQRRAGARGRAALRPRGAANHPCPPRQAWQWPIAPSVEPAAETFGKLDQDSVGIGDIGGPAARPLHRRVIELQLEAEIVDAAHRLVHVVDDEADMIDMDVAGPVDPALHLEEADVESVLGAEDAPAHAVVLAALLAFDPEQAAIEIDRRIEVANREVHVVDASRHHRRGALRHAADRGRAARIVLNGHGRFPPGGDAR